MHPTLSLKLIDIDVSSMVRNSIVPQIGISVVHSLLHTSVIIREHTEGDFFLKEKKKEKSPAKHAFTPLPCWLKVMGLP